MLVQDQQASSHPLLSCAEPLGLGPTLLMILRERRHRQINRFLVWRKRIKASPGSSGQGVASVLLHISTESTSTSPSSSGPCTQGQCAEITLGHFTQFPILCHKFRHAMPCMSPVARAGHQTLFFLFWFWFFKTEFLWGTALAILELTL